MGSEKKASGNGDRSTHPKKQKKVAIPAHRKSASEVLVPMGWLFAFVSVVLGFVYKRYGPTMFLGYAAFDLHYTAPQWKKILSQKTILLIGGPHRGGTTLLWEAITRHGDISGFGNTFTTGRDHSEGILMQDVYPNLGVGTENFMKHQKRSANLPEGVGRYALADEAKVHFVESDKRVTPKNFAKLLNRFGAFWNLSKSVVVEKSPPTAVMSRFLEALYNVPVPAVEGGPTTKFLFITRHPLGNIYAQQAFLGVGTVSLTKLMDNYIMMHKYMLSDMTKLRNDPKLVKLEDFVLAPKETLSELYQWLGLQDVPVSLDDLNIQSDPNSKYKHMADCSETFQHALRTKYQPQVDAMGLGYNLLDWCD